MIAQSYEEFPLSLDDPMSRSRPEAFSLSNLDPNSPRPYLFLMGTPRSGKTSIEKVVFHKMSPHETLYLDSTLDVNRIDIHSNFLVSFKILDFPGGYNFRASEVDSLKACSALVLVVDATDSSHDNEDIIYLVDLVKLAIDINSKINFEILIHKVDGDAFPLEEHRLEAQRDTRAKIITELREANIQDARMSFHLTSIYDHTIFEAFSKICQKLIPEFGYLENLLDSFLTSSCIEKVFLFDISSKVYVCTDSNPVDMQTYELCSDMIDVILDVSCIYGMPANASEDPKVHERLAVEAAFGAGSGATIKLSDGHVLMLREIGQCLAVVCLMRQKTFDKAALIEYNIDCLRSALTNLSERIAQQRAPEVS